MFDRKFQAVSDDRLISHSAAMPRGVDWHAKNARVEQPFWKPSALQCPVFSNPLVVTGPPPPQEHTLQ